MAALYESYTLCALADTGPEGTRAIEPGRDRDRVVITESGRAVTVYKVSDQKPLGSWTVKQGQCITSPAVYNSQTKEYVVVTDEKVVRVWNDEDISIEKAFKATVSAEVYRVHSVPDQEPLVLFRHGAVRFLDSLLAAPQQPIEEVLSEEEVIRWSAAVQTEQQLVLLFSTEQRGQHCLYVQRFSPNALVKHKLETDSTNSAPLSYAATYRDGNIHLLYLFSSGCVYESVLQAWPTVPAVSETVQALPRSLLLKLPVGEGELTAASALPIDEAHIAVVGVPHPSAGAGKDYLCIWNTHFQTLQAGRELAGKIYGQLWCYSGKLFVPHGKTLSVIPFECQKSSLAAAMGKLKQTSVTNESNSGPTLVPSWNALLHADQTQTQTQERSRGAATKKSKTSTRNQSSCPTAEQLAEKIKVGSEKEVQKQVEAFLHGSQPEELQLTAGRLASALVTRCQADPTFYPQAALTQLVQTNYLCHSGCPDLLMLTLEKSDFCLCQLCLQLFQDIPEAVTCWCLKTILSVQDSELEQVDLEEDSLLFMKALTQTAEVSDGDSGQPNGFCPPVLEEESCDAPPDSEVPGTKPPRDPLALDMSCPVGPHKGALLNEVLQTPYSDSLLLPHLKDLSVPQVILLLQYLRFLYLKYSQDAHSRIPALRKPAVTQIMDWVCLLLDAHFTVLVLAPEAKSLLSSLHKFVRSQVKLYSELGKIEGSLEALKKSKQSREIGQYSIEVIELF
ncbi:nucleolar protein 11-like [Colossoma macropomum]|uniref:nucleolar protein 11-like n=1 Tax=Colossoma macropomum TaxID=42526 RepID=UPI0018642B79|nr:nucleolar protein 11-like [Colossoma macropomum]